MKKTLQISAFALLLIVAMISCRKETNSIKDIGFTIKELDLAAGASKTLVLNVHPLNADDFTVIWTSSNENVATVSALSENPVDYNYPAKGIVLGKSAGTAVITATTKSGGHTATCTINVKNADPEMIFVEGGTFTMGCTATDGSCFSLEVPPHEVTLSNFSISKYTITQKQWRFVMDRDPIPDYLLKDDNMPAIFTQMSEVISFINRLNELTGKNYRLATEAEWEYAAKGGNKSLNYIYSGSNNIDEVGWCRSNCDFFHAVGEKKPNELGIYDMSGNIWELCSDWFWYYSDEPQVNPTGPQTGTHYVMRGGTFYLNSSDCIVTSRWYAEIPRVFLGIRVVLP